MNDSAPLVMIVEDEPKIASLLVDYAHQTGYRTRCLVDGTGATEAILTAQPDAVLLDINLPGVDGLSICREVRARSDVPILLVTARVEEIDRLLGLELGADDYVCKPFSPREVMARVKVILRRTAPATPWVCPLVIDESRFEASIDGHALDLTRTEFNLLAALARPLGRVLSRDQLMDHAYPDHRIVADRSIDSHIKNLRRKLEDKAPDRRPIRSVYGVGYKLDL